MSKFILAALTFAFINLLLFLAGPLLTQIFNENAGHRRIIDGLVYVKKMPDILLLGSSIIRLPLWMCDFQIDKNTPAYNRFFEVNSCKQQLLKKYNCNVRVADAALDGAMISDIYFFVQRAINNNHKPKLILLCIAPRDFADSIFPDETKTVTFACLFKSNDLINNSVLFCLTPGQRAKLLAEQVYFLHEYSDKIKTELVSFISKISKNNYLDKEVLLEGTANPLTVKDPKSRSLREYRLRYGNLRLGQIDKQGQYLEKLADYCSCINVPIVVVNMPLTEANKSLLPNNYYAMYLNRIHDICSYKKIQIVDLANEGFKESDFYDTAHLNDKGGLILIDKLSEVIASKQKANYSEDFFKNSDSAFISESNNGIK